MLSCCSFCFCSQMDFLLHPSFTVSLFFGPSLRLFFTPSLSSSLPQISAVGALPVSLTPVLRSVGCLWHLPALPFVSFWCYLVGSAQCACARAFVISVRVCTCSRSLSLPELVGREW